MIGPCKFDHSSQMEYWWVRISLRTSCWLLPQNEQYSVFLESLVADLTHSILRRRSITRSTIPVPSRT